MMVIISTIDTPVTINNNPMEPVEEFTYLGSLGSKDNAPHKDITARLGKVCGAFTPSESHSNTANKPRSNYIRVMSNLFYYTVQNVGELQSVIRTTLKSSVTPRILAKEDH